MTERTATEADLHRVARGMPFVTVEQDGTTRPIYQVGRKSFVFFRTPRPDAFDPVTGERYDDVVVIWVDGEATKQGLVQDPSTPFFTTPHFDGHPSVLLRLSRVGELTVSELTEVIEDAWLARASERRRTNWAARARLIAPAQHERPPPVIAANVGISPNPSRLEGCARDPGPSAG